MKLLVIDDEQGVRDVLSNMLKTIIDSAHEVYTVSSGEAAIELAKQMKFDGAFTDMQMPGLDGLDTFRAFRKILPDIKIILMSGHASQDRIDAALREGAIDFLTKPFTTEDVKAILQRN